MNEFTLIPAEPAHIQAIAALEAANFSVPCTAGMIAAHLDRYAVVTDGAALCGYITLSSVLDTGSLDSIAVDPAYRRRGIADALIAYARSWAMQNALCCIQLEVRAGNAPALALYEKHGFRTDGRRKNYYIKPREDAILMTMVIEAC